MGFYKPDNTNQTQRMSLRDLNEGVKGLLLVMLWDDFRQELVLALGQFHKGTNAVNVRIYLDVQHVISPWGNSTSS